jgi:hypothetical protein
MRCSWPRPSQWSRHDGGEHPRGRGEVRALFERYEQALIDKDVAVLDATFWNSPNTIRYAIHENGYGFDEIHAHRVRRPPGPGIKLARRRL